MTNEPALRRKDFVGGTRVRLADGREWSLPGPVADRSDPEYEAIVCGVLEAEDQADRRRAELALTIWLLGRNYRLSADDYARLLDFAPDAPALRALQAAVHALAAEHARCYKSGRTPAQVPGAVPAPASSRLPLGGRPGWLSRTFSAPFRRGMRTST